MLASEPALLEDDGRAEKDSDNTEGGERNERNHQDGHKSLLIEILELESRTSRDHDHGLL